MKKPMILVNGGPALDKTFEHDSWCMPKNYVRAVGSAGGAPVLCAGDENAEEYAELCDGLLMTGAFSYASRPETWEQMCQWGQPRRVEYDRRLFEAFAAAGKPIFGVCLGQQVINLFLGGMVSYNFKFKTATEHMMTAHTVRTAPGSVLHELFGEEFSVNSRHSNAIEALAPGLKATAWSPDGIVEAVEHKTLPIWGFQFHPERMRGDLPDPPQGPDMSPLFRWFVDQCRK